MFKASIYALELKKKTIIRLNVSKWHYNSIILNYKPFY